MMASPEQCYKRQETLYLLSLTRIHFKQSHYSLLTYR